MKDRGGFTGDIDRVPNVEPKNVAPIMFGLMLSLFLANLDQTIVATCLPAIAHDLQGWELLPWVVSAYLVTSTATTPIYGRLSDHYDPTKRALFLSSDNFHGRTVAAVGVAAHESGHALQHQAAYGLFTVRMALVPVTNFASMAYMGIMLLGMFMGLFGLALWIIIATFSVITLFQLVTLPVEYDASRRAKEQLFRLGLVHEHERAGVSKVLDAAALTYVAALVSSILTLLYYITLARDSRR